MVDINKQVDDIVAQVDYHDYDLFSDEDFGTIDVSHTSQHEPSALLYTYEPVPEWNSNNGWCDYNNTFPDDWHPNQLQPRGYQIKGVEWLESHKRTILTDQPGLGKTLQAAEAAKNHKPVLVCAPTYLVKQWYEFLTTQYPKDKVNIALGLYKSKKEALEDPTCDWCVVNTQMLRTHDIPVRFTKGTIIFDEFHHLRNRDSQQAKAAALVAQHNPEARVYGLTATPIWKEVDDLWHLFYILYPNIFPNYNDFVKTFCISDEDAYGGAKVKGVKLTMIKELEAVLDMMRLGRSYEDVGRVLPEIIEKTIMVDMNSKTRALYDKVRSGYLAAVEADRNYILTSFMEILHSLRKITANYQKMDAVADALDDSYLAMPPEKRRPVMIFTWYKETGYMLLKHLQEDKRFSDIKMCFISGDVPITDRANMAMEHDIVIASIPALAEGVNMYHARTVMFVEEHWPPGANYQALSRVRRDRNDNGADIDPVIVYYFRCTDSVDEYIHQVSQDRSKTIQEVLEECLK